MFEKIKKVLDNKKILILGFGKEGRSTLSFISDFINAKSITVADKMPQDVPDKVLVKFGEGYMSDLDEYDVIIKSPGIVFSGQSNKILSKTTSQTDLFLRQFRDSTVGITGTKGKSTTTTLLYHVMKFAGVDAVLTGNIGIPPLDSARQMKNDTIAIFEMSCHQLEFEDVSPHIAVVLNLFEDHLDHYVTRENYVRAKENIFLHQKEDDYLFISPLCTEQIKKAPFRVIQIGDGSEYQIPYEEISLVGEHNFYNIRAVKAVADIFSISEDIFTQALKTYKPLPHRLEYVATKNGVDYYDDSISTVCQTTIQAILSLKNVETVIIGGMDRGIDYTELVDFLKKNPVKNTILIYESGKRIAKMLEKNNVDYILSDTLEEAVKLSASLTKEGGKCVLSPAAASYGYFKNFEERGDVFRQLVNNL